MFIRKFFARIRAFCYGTTPSIRVIHRQPMRYNGHEVEKISVGRTIHVEICRECPVDGQHNCGNQFGSFGGCEEAHNFFYGSHVKARRPTGGF